ncbi:hypothetical protein VM1G_11633 [Cytospora mali]|uniref:Uncharacterized protein n=1 Tax=Cytospora mali TaxID=578113 RepID=A0A194W0F2_CYTMA|nr:hypothetical protein VM1G_11633 [Valsa mali]
MNQIEAPPQSQPYPQEPSPSWQHDPRAYQSANHERYQHPHQKQLGDYGSSVRDKGQLGPLLLPDPLIGPSPSFEAAVAAHIYRERRRWGRVQMFWDDQCDKGYYQQWDARLASQPTVQSRDQYQPLRPAELYRNEDAGYRPRSPVHDLGPEAGNTQKPSAPTFAQQPIQEEREEGERAIGREQTRRSKVMPNGSPVLNSARAIPTTRPSCEHNNSCQESHNPEEHDDCTFCLRSNYDFNNAWVSRDENGKWAVGPRPPVDFSGVQRRLFQSVKNETRGIKMEDIDDYPD